MKLKSNKIEVIIKDEITRKEDREYNEILYHGAKSTDSGALDRSSLLSNVEEQKDSLILLYVEKYDGKPLTREIIDKMTKSVYNEILEACQKRYIEEEEKKS